MSREKKKGIVAAALTILVCSCLILGLRFFFFHKVRNALADKFEKLDSKGYKVTYDSIDVDWKTGKLFLKNLVVRKNSLDTLCLHPEFFAASEVRAEGLNFISGIISRELNFTELKIRNPRLTIRENSLFLNDSTAKRRDELSISAGKINLDSVQIEYLDSLSCEPTIVFHSNIQLTDALVEVTPDKKTRTTFGDLSLENASIKLLRKFYTIKIANTSLQHNNGRLTIDSISIIPQFGRNEFARKVGEETDRIEGMIPRLELRGLKINYDDTLVIHSSHLALSAYLNVFRDKRLPFKNRFKPLPMEWLQDLDFGLSIDTLELNNSYVHYEELENNTAPAVIFFDDLDATIVGINNDRHLMDGKTIMQAKAEFMGEGVIKVRSEFPWNNSRKCLIEGSLEEMPISKVNSLIGSVANMKAKSGQLNRMDFSFAYTAIKSQGRLELNYKDLKIITFKEEEKQKKKGKREENKLKTWIVNTFVIRKDMDEKVATGKRSGKIGFYRDTSRSIFNYWWKSLLSGLRDAFHLDRFNERDNRRNKKKQRK